MYAADCVSWEMYLQGSWQCSVNVLFLMNFLYEFVSRGMLIFTIEHHLFCVLTILGLSWWLFQLWSSTNIVLTHRLPCDHLVSLFCYSVIDFSHHCIMLYGNVISGDIFSQLIIMLLISSVLILNRLHMTYANVFCLLSSRFFGRNIFYCNS